MDETHEPENELEQPEPEDSLEEVAEESAEEIIDEIADLEPEAIVDEVEASVEDFEDESAEALDDVVDETEESVSETVEDALDAADPDMGALEPDDSQVDEYDGFDEDSSDEWVEKASDEYEPEPDDDFGIPLPDTDFDVVGALASVSALSDVMAEEEALRSQEMAQVEAERQAAAERVERRDSYAFPRPRVVAVERGRMASFIPALLLIVIGAYLTYLTTSSTGFSPDAGVILAGAGVALGILMLVYWLASSRWHYGSLFGGLSVILSAGVLYWLSQSDDPGVQGWPLVVSAIGVAAILSAILSAERRGVQAFTGLLLILAGVIGMVVTTEALGEDITDLTETVGPIVLIAIVVLLTIPSLLRLRRG